jgi:hypothetical protein
MTWAVEDRVKEDLLTITFSSLLILVRSSNHSLLQVLAVTDLVILAATGEGACACRDKQSSGDRRGDGTYR